MGRIEVFSPAKINLFLSVVGRMDDGYHQLVSLVAPLDFGDRIRIQIEESETASVELTCSDADLPTDERNLAFSAAARFLKRYGITWRVRIELQKSIPHGAGLGGGSSNASAVLEGLSVLAAHSGLKPIEDVSLHELAQELGSDCPLFLAKRPLVMRGRGERLEPISEAARSRLSGRRALLFKPSVSISTQWAYGKLAESPEGYGAESWAEDRISAWEAGRIRTGELLSNSFESVAFAKYPGIGCLLEKLRAQGIRCLMSGSGSCCFALLDGGAEEEVARSLIQDAWGGRAFVQLARIS